MAAALAAGVREIRVFGDIAAARAAAAAFEGPPARRLLCGEENCHRPAGFDLGNSPAAFDAKTCAGRVAFMSTTNGTRAILAARGARALLVGALVNAGAVARAAAALQLPVTLLCAGTNGQVAMEDLIGAGAVLDALLRADVPTAWRPSGDVALIARHLFAAARPDLPRVLAQAQGGQNVLAAGLGQDIDFAGRVDVLEAVGVVDGASPVVRPWGPAAAGG
jgi:2-phosphosulfolactate phosphatase